MDRYGNRQNQRSGQPGPDQCRVRDFPEERAEGQGIDDERMPGEEGQVKRSVLVGQAVYGGHTISAIFDEGEKFSIYIESEAQQKIWKDVYKTMGVSVEFDLDD